MVRKWSLEISMMMVCTKYIWISICDLHVFLKKQELSLGTQYIYCTYININVIDTWVLYCQILESLCICTTLILKPKCSFNACRSVPGWPQISPQHTIWKSWTNLLEKECTQHKHTEHFRSTLKGDIQWDPYRINHRTSAPDLQPFLKPSRGSSLCFKCNKPVYNPCCLFKHPTTATLGQEVADVNVNLGRYWHWGSVISLGIFFFPRHRILRKQTQKIK